MLPLYRLMSFASEPQGPQKQGRQLPVLETLVLMRQRIERPNDGLSSIVIHQGLNTIHAAAHATFIHTTVRYAIREDIMSIDPTVSRDHRFSNTVTAS